jgi:hypothetical protein
MTIATSTRRTTWAEAVIMTLAVLNTIAALGGAWGLINGVIDLGPDVVERLPLESPVLAGLALGMLVGLPNLALAGLATVRHPRTAAGSVAVGIAMIVWIAVQLAIIREFSFFHPTYVVVGAAMIAAGVRQTRQR